MKRKQKDRKNMRKQRTVSLRRVPVYYFRPRTLTALLTYEFFMESLVVLSVGMLVYALAGHPSHQQALTMDWIEFAVACVFMAEFFVGLVKSEDKWRYMRSAWWLLLASIPITGDLGDALRAFRLVGIVRTIQVASHIVHHTKKYRTAH